MSRRGAPTVLRTCPECKLDTPGGKWAYVQGCCVDCRAKRPRGAPRRRPAQPAQPQNQGVAPPENAPLPAGNGSKTDDRYRSAQSIREDVKDDLLGALWQEALKNAAARAAATKLPSPPGRARAPTCVACGTTESVFRDEHDRTICETCAAGQAEMYAAQRQQSPA